MPPLDDKVEIEEPSAESLIAKGKRDLKCQDPQSAAECFAKACEMLSQQLGDLHDDLGMPNLLYGTALLDLARAENNILGEQVKDKEISSDEDEEDEENKSEDKEAVEENETKDKGAGEEKNMSVEGEDVSEGNMKPTEEAINQPEEPRPSTSSGITHEVEETTEELENDDEIDGGEITTLQLAWEVIEVAKQIFAKHDDAEHKLKYADCLERLSEIAEESGNIDDAIRDLFECLDIRKTHAPDDLRLTAVTYFQIAMAYSYKEDYNLADEYLGYALDYLQRCRVQYESELCSIDKDDESKKERFCVLEVYIAEVDGLIKDLTDRRNEICESSTAVKDLEETPRKTIDKDAPVDDITHLIKKKRPAKEETSEEFPAKKARTEDSENSS